MHDLTNQTGKLQLSVVIVGREGFRSINPILTCLTEQTVAKSMEIIAVLPEPEAPPGDVSTETFGRWVVVTVGKIGNRGAAAAEGVRHATADLLAFTENHCFPDPQWAEYLIQGSDTAYAGVSPTIYNANPETPMSRAMYTLGYRRFAFTPAQELDELPMHNACFRREHLTPLGNDLEYFLADERRLHKRLRENGARFGFLETAVARHINESTWSLFIQLNFCNGRRFGGRRGQSWHWGRRLFYAAAFPVLSIPIWRENRRGVRRTLDHSYAGIRYEFLLWMGALMHASGEAFGYLTGPKDTFDFVDAEEFMILERLSNTPLANRRISRYIELAQPVSPR